MYWHNIREISFIFFIRIRNRKLIHFMISIQLFCDFQLFVKEIFVHRKWYNYFSKDPFGFAYNLKMGNHNSPQKYQKFQQDDWVLKQQLPDFQVWENKKQPFQRIEQHEIYAHNSEQTENQKKIFQLRRRNPLLVAAYYLQSNSQRQMCSFYSHHALYLQRIPLRLCDIQHVPYPDYLHLYDACLKGFAQIARCIGFFPINQAMIGINQRGIAKVWLNQDLAKSSPTNQNINQQNMVKSLIDSIDRSIDSELLPPSVPSVRNFLYKNSDSIKFDTAIWSLGQYIRYYNSSQIPIKLDCIDRVGGVYAIVNRQNSSKLGRSSVSNRQIGKSTVGNRQFQELYNSNAKVSSNQQHQNHFHTVTNSISPLSANLRFVKSQSNLNTQQIMRLEPNTIQQNRSFYRPPSRIQQRLYTQPSRPLIIASSSNQNSFNQNQYVPIKIQNNQINQSTSNSSNKHITFVNAKIEQKMNVPSSVRSSQHIIQQMPLVTPQRKIPQAIYTPRSSNAPKFTVEVIPGKVYPQKSSTIFIQSSSKVIQPENSQQQISSLEQNNPVLTTSQKYVSNEQATKEQGQKLQNIGNQLLQELQIKDNVVEHKQEEPIEQIDSLQFQQQNQPKVQQQIVEINNVQVIQNEENDVQKYNQNQLGIQSKQDVQNQLIVSFNPSKTKASEQNYFSQSYQPRSQTILNNQVEQLANNNEYQYEDVYNTANQYEYIGHGQQQQPYQHQYSSYPDTFNNQPQSYTLEQKVPQQNNYNESKFHVEYGNYQDYSNNDYNNYDPLNSKIRNTFQTQGTEPYQYQKDIENKYNYYDTNLLNYKDYSNNVQNEGKGSYKFISELSQFQDIKVGKSVSSNSALKKQSMNPSSYSDYLNNLVSQSNQIYGNNYSPSSKSIIDSIGVNKYGFKSYEFKPQATLEHDVQ